jgi:AcrR family transcriptional regulator
MNRSTADRPAPQASVVETPPGEGLRERKKRLMRRQLSDTATALFLARGFDAVSVAEIAESCGVSEKTVFNYFPTKESLLLDRWDATLAALRTALADPALSPAEAALRVLSAELAGMTALLEAHEDPSVAAAQLLRFGDLLRSTPALRARRHDMADELAVAAAEALAERYGAEPESPECQIAASALIGLWQVQIHSLRTHLAGGTHSAAQLRKAVTGDVERAARLLDAGLGSLEDRSGGEGPRRDGRRAVFNRPPRQ